MTRIHSSSTHRPTKVEKLLAVLGDHRYHSTKELARRVGHTFHVAIFHARRAYLIERRRHPTKSRQHQYRIPQGNNG